MKEKYEFLKNPSFKSQILAKTKSFDPNDSNKNPSKMFSFSLNQSHNYRHHQSEQKFQILNCFNNLSSLIQNPTQSIQLQAIRCKRTFKKQDQQSQLPKFSSIQEEVENSLDKILLKDQLNLINKASIKKYYPEDQYSFNGQENQTQIQIKEKNTKYDFLMKKIDHFLVKDFTQEQSSMHHINFKKKQKKKSSHKQKCNKFQKILQEQSTVRQKLDFLSSYAQSLEEQNLHLKSQISKNLEKQEKIKVLQKQMYEKQIVIKFLSAELLQKYQNLQEKISKNNIQQIQRQNLNQQSKQRYTVSGINVQQKKKKHSQRQRVSHYVQSNKQNCYNNRQNKLSQGMSNNSDQQKSKSNSFMRKVFQKSQYSNNVVNQKDVHKNFKCLSKEDSLIVDILKEQNSVLSTKLNILYGDFQQMIDKYNQVLTQKSICKSKCCTSRYIQQKQRNLSNIVQSKTQSQLKSINIKNCSHICVQKQIKQLIYKLKNDLIFKSSNFQLTQQTCHNQIDQLLLERDLFSSQDYINARIAQKNKILSEKQIQIKSNKLNNCQTDRSMLINKTWKNINQFNEIQKSLNFSQGKRLSAQLDKKKTNQKENRFSYHQNYPNMIFKRQNDKSKEQNKPRQRIAPKASNRDSYKYKQKFQVFRE